MTAPKILTLDIETSPNLAHVWGLWKQTVALSQLLQRGSVIAFAAKWHGKKPVMFHSDHHDGHKEMVEAAHALTAEADIVVTYNGLSFDMPLLRREFLLAGMAPPAPWRDVDLCRVVKTRFRFVSNKLDNVTRELGLDQKLSHTGHQLWVDCMKGDPRAWALMRRYNKQDVVITEQLYDRLLPWIPNHPDVGLYTGVQGCPKCGGDRLQRRGIQVTAASSFQRWHCQDCGGWSRSARRESATDLRAVTP